MTSWFKDQRTTTEPHQLGAIVFVVPVLSCGPGCFRPVKVLLSFFPPKDSSAGHPEYQGSEGMEPESLRLEDNDQSSDLASKWS